MSSQVELQKELDAMEKKLAEIEQEIEPIWISGSGEASSRWVSKPV